VAIRDSAQVALRAARINAYLALAFGVALVATGWIGIPLLFVVEFTAAYPPLVALAPGIVFISMQRVCGPPVLRAGTPWLLTGIYAVSLAANISLNLVWIPQVRCIRREHGVQHFIWPGRRPVPRVDIRIGGLHRGPEAIAI